MGPLDSADAGALVRHPSTLDRTHRSGAVSTANVAFDGDVLTWDDLPARTRADAAHSTALVAECAVCDPGPLVEDGRTLQVLRGWRAHRDLVLVAVAVRPLVPAPGFGMRAVGPWEHRSLTTHAVRGVPERRTGTVPADVAPAAGGDAPGPSVTRPPGHHSAAAATWPYLPGAVRAGAEAVVPVPDVWLGDLVQQRSPDGFPVAQDVTVLRLSATRAVVVRATRAVAEVPGATVREQTTRIAATAWLIEQVSFVLGRDDEPRTALPPRR